jgi:purine-binding chemotaxis protein CheW
MINASITEAEDNLLVSTFSIGDALFGIDANQVQEVVQLRKITAVHHAPDYVRGVMNLRGRVVSVIDLGEKLSLGAIESDAENRIMIVEWRQEYVGLLVARIEEVVQVETEAIKRPPENVHGVQASLITGVFQSEAGRLIGLLDIDKVLAIGDKSSAEAPGS